LTLIFGYGNGAAGFNAAYPFAGASLQASITTYGPAAIGGLALTALGVLLMAWALICGIIGQIQLIGPAPRIREREVVRVPEVREREVVRVPERDKHHLPLA
jgi:hypothetical protein